ncbi:DUF2590 family protein [Klebsiella michiganensis]|uniref:DUF2590 family protein n=1 Tax=Klebsiella TaxID=570 RepID=UPI0013D5C267|nr:DUF2590 family protein [Klebsiella michiganensis]EIY5008386.1 DUF2590 family protein [Klebsiella variicola]MBG2583629.1 DUF2590 family protein [Klebsiella michiganensis]MBG2593643.1 DUF2590 family protein [Klebsiella michiganensis]MDQ7855525.1 DUF2590 family protein [Klebsiella michiganensis]HAT3609912.1 DUF2590 family protein [Klebsiella michiganensis]
MTDKNLYIDLQIIDGNFVLNSGNEPVTCNNRDSIAQDIIHMIIESELTKQLVAERSRVLRADTLLQLEMLVETDDRIVPGTVSLNEEATGRYLITADTWDFGPLAEELTV